MLKIRCELFDLGLLKFHPTSQLKGAAVPRARLSLAAINIDVEVDEMLLSTMRVMLPDATWEFSREPAEKVAPLSALSSQRHDPYVCSWDFCACVCVRMHV